MEEFNMQHVMALKEMIVGDQDDEELENNF
jgi:hypothetical protein